MGKTKTLAAPRMARPKSAAALAKKAANEQAAAKRLARLQAEQAKVNAIREEIGLPLSDSAARELLAQQRDTAERQAETNKAREFVEGVLSGPFGGKVSKWIGRKGLAGDPCKVAVVVKMFCATQGYNLKKG